MQSQLWGLDENVLYYIKLAPPVTVESPSKTLPWPTVKWVPVISLKVIEPHQQSDIKRPAIARRLEAMCKAIAGSSKYQTKYITKMIHEALHISVGGGQATKKSWMRTKIQAERRPNSGRAVIAPTGLPLIHRDESEDDSLLGIDAIGFPNAVVT